MKKACSIPVTAGICICAIAVVFTAIVLRRNASHLAPHADASQAHAALARHDGADFAPPIDAPPLVFAPSSTQAPDEMDPEVSPEEDSAHVCKSDCQDHQRQPSRVFGGPRNPFTLEQLPASKMKTQLTNLGEGERKSALALLNQLPFTDLDLPRLFVTPDGKSIGFDCRPLNLLDTPPGNDSMDGKLSAITTDCFNPDHVGPTLRYQLEAPAQHVHLNTQGVELPSSWYEANTTIIGQKLPHDWAAIAGIEQVDFQTDQILYAAEIEAPPEAGLEAEPSPPTEAGEVTTTIRRCLVIFANTTDKIYPEAQKTAVLARLFTDSKNVNSGLRAASYGQLGIELGDAITVNLDVRVSEATNGSMVSYMTTAANNMGYPTLNYDRVLYMCPDGTRDTDGSGWTAYAQIGGRRSVYSYEWSTHLQGIVHELGHNEKFDHSGLLNGNEYDDYTCAMGRADMAGQCPTFGAAKKIQADWFDAFPGTYQKPTTDATYDLYPIGIHPDATPGVRAVEAPDDFAVSYVRHDNSIYAALHKESDYDKVIIQEYLSIYRISRKHVSMGLGKFTKNGVDIIFERYGPNREYATVSFDFPDGNFKPLANTLNLAIQQNSSRIIPLPIYDQDPADTLVCSIVEQPTHGALVLNGAQVTYTPNANFTGSDSFVYKVSDGKISSFGTINLSVFSSMSMLVSSPNGGEQLPIGTQQTIHWGASSGGNVRIELFKGHALHSLIASSVPNSGSYQWTVPVMDAGNDFRIKITRLQSPNEWDFSDANFSIIPALQMAYSTPGQFFYRGASRSIAWTSGIRGMVKIELTKGGVIDRTIAASTPNDGYFEWTIPTLQDAGTDYNIRISSVESPAIFATMADNFSILVQSNILRDDNMDSNPGYIANGGFEYGTPAATNVPSKANTGSKIYDTLLNGNVSDYANLTTPAIDCSHHAGVTVSFYENVYTQSTYVVDVSNNGSSWQRLSSVTGVGEPIDNWTHRAYDISAVADGQKTVYIRWMKFTGPEWPNAGVAIDDVLVTGTLRQGPIVPNVSITESASSTEVTEGGATDSYTVRLDSEPSSNVTVNVIPDVTQVTTSASSLTFTPANWNTPQTVTVTAINDTAHELMHSDIIQHTTTSADAAYHNLSVASVTAKITDNDNQAPTVVITPSSTELTSIAAAWTPKNQPSLLFWTDASDAASITHVDGSVSQILDKSGNDDHLTQSDPNKQPKTGIRKQPADIGRNVLVCDGDDWMSAANVAMPSTGDFSAFIVAAPETVDSSFDGLYSFTTTSGASFYFDAGSDTEFRGRLNWHQTFRPAAPSANAGPSIYNALIHHTGGKQSIYVDGTSKLTNNSYSSKIGSVQNLNMFTNSTQSPAGFFGEMVVLEDYTTLTRQKIEGYLAHKWRLTSKLPAGHPYLEEPPKIPGAVSTVTLNGTVNDSDSGDSPTTVWSLESTTPAGLSMSFADPYAVDTTATFDEVGTYVLKLTASDGLSTTSNTVTIHVIDLGINYTVTYTAGANGSISGTTPQTVREGRDGTPVTAVPNSGYTFIHWSDGSTANPRTDANVMADISVTANFEYNQAPTADAGKDQPAVLIDTRVTWTPAVMTPKLWLDAKDASSIITEGATTGVRTWNDKSGNANHVHQADTTKQPSTGATINSFNAIDFTGDLMTTTTNPFGSTVSNGFVMVVHKVDATTNGILFSLTGATMPTGSRWQGHAPWEGQMIFDVNASTTGANRVSAAYGVSAGSTVMTSFYCSTTDKVQQVYKNGALLAGDSTGASASTVSGLSIGGVGTTYQNTTIGELLVINGTVSVDDRQKLEGYLAHQWGLAASLPSSPKHPYKDAAPVTGDFGATVTLNGLVGDSNQTAPTATWSVVSTQPAGLSVEFADAASPVTTATFYALGTYTLRLTADDGVAAPVSDDVVITVIESTTYTDWLAGPFAKPFTDTAMTSNPDGDRRSNMMEFAFGTDPTIIDMGPLATDGSKRGDPVASKEGGGGHALYYVRRTDHGNAGSVIYSTHFSPDLTTFTPSSTGLVVVSSAGTGYELVKVPFPSGARFGYVKIEAAP